MSVHDSVYRVGRSLEMEQLGVLTPKRHQLIMSALLDNSSMIENVDPVGGPYRGEPVRDDQRAAAAQHLVQRGEQLVLCSRIKRCRRLTDDH